MPRPRKLPLYLAPEGRAVLVVGGWCWALGKDVQMAEQNWRLVSKRRSTSVDLTFFDVPEGTTVNGAGSIVYPADKPAPRELFTLEGN